MSEVSNTIFLNIIKNISKGRNQKGGCDICGEVGDHVEVEVAKILHILLLPKPQDGSLRNSMGLCTKCNKMLRNVLDEYVKLEELRQAFLDLQSSLMGAVIKNLRIPGGNMKKLKEVSTKSNKCF